MVVSLNKGCDGRRFLDASRAVRPVEFQSVLRLRPLSKKEREDHSVFELSAPHPPGRSFSSPAVVTMKAMPRSDGTVTGAASTSALSNHNSIPPPFASSSSSSPAVVTMKAMPRFDSTTTGAECTSSALSNHNSVPPPFASPETVRTTYEKEFCFDRAYDEYATQDGDLFAENGRQMSLAAMEPLFDPEAPRKTHLNIALGLTGSGKTYTCWGNTSGAGANLRRRQETDGLIPRMIDSLFGQYQRLASISPSNVRGRLFAVKISALQVNQPKNSKSSNRDSGRLYDLMKSVSSKMPGMEGDPRRTSMDRQNNTTTSASPPPKRRASLDALEQAVYIDQNPLTHDFRVMNSKNAKCRSSDEARQVLQHVLHAIRKVSSRRNQCHVLVQLQPLLVDQETGTKIRVGGVIAYLDMAGSEDINAAQTRKRLKDSLPGRCDAHASVIHCLRSILFNELIRQGAMDDSDANIIDTKTRRRSLTRATSAFKQVPFLQHNVTMLLQPYFSPNHTDQTVVTLLLLLSPSHCDYMEKRELLAEIESLWKPFHRDTVQADTGLVKEQACEPIPSCESKDSLSKEQPRQKLRASSHIKKQIHKSTEMPATHNLKAIPPGAFQQKTRAPKALEKIHAVPSTDSTSSAESFERPPPMVPPTPCLAPANDVSSKASAPMEEECLPFSHGNKYVVPMDRSQPSDFPGVDISAHTQCRPESSCPPSKSTSGEPIALPQKQQRSRSKSPRQKRESGEGNKGRSGNRPTKSTSVEPITQPQKQQRSRSKSPKQKRASGGGNKGQGGNRSQSRSPLRPTFARNGNRSKACGQPRDNMMAYGDEKSQENSPVDRGATKWTRTVEITTTTIESSNSDHPAKFEKPAPDLANTVGESVSAGLSGLKKENDVLKNEMQELKRQNDLLQQQLKGINPTPSQPMQYPKSVLKSVTWKEDRFQTQSHSHDDDGVVEEHKPSYHRPGKKHKKASGQRSTGPPKPSSYRYNPEDDNDDDSAVEDVTPSAYHSTYHAVALRTEQRNQSSRKPNSSSAPAAATSLVGNQALLREKMAKYNAVSRERNDESASPFVFSVNNSHHMSGFKLHHPVWQTQKLDDVGDEICRNQFCAT